MTQTAAPIDVAALRADTAGCSDVVHLNNAGSSLPPDRVVEAVVAHLRREAAVGGYEAAADAADAVDRSTAAVADLLRCRADQIAFQESATRAWHSAFYGMALQPGDRILTGLAEYASNALPFLVAAERTGCEIDVIPDDEHGQIDVAELARRLDDRVKVVAITHVPTNGGLVNPAADVGAVVAGSGALYLLDACQSAGQIDLDVGALRCDMLTATGRKFLRAPRGTGFLFVSDRALAQLQPAVVDLHSAEWTEPSAFTWAAGAQRFEVWECAVAARIGMGVAVDYALEVGLPAIEARVGALGARLRDGLAEIAGVTVWDKGAVRCGIVTFTLDGTEAAALSSTLRLEHRINTSVSLPSSTRWDADDRQIPPLVRASVHAYNTEDEVDLLLAAVSGAR